MRYLRCYDNLTKIALNWRLVVTNMLLLNTFVALQFFILTMCDMFINYLSVYGCITHDLSY